MVVVVGREEARRVTHHNYLLSNPERRALNSKRLSFERPISSSPLSFSYIGYIQNDLFSISPISEALCVEKGERKTTSLGHSWRQVIVNSTVQWVSGGLSSYNKYTEGNQLGSLP